MICIIEPQWVKLFVGNNGKSLVPAAILLYVRCGLSANCRAAGVPTLKGTTGTTTCHDFPDVADTASVRYRQATFDTSTSASGRGDGNRAWIGRHVVTDAFFDPSDRI